MCSLLQTKVVPKLASSRLSTMKRRGTSRRANLAVTLTLDMAARNRLRDMIDSVPNIAVKEPALVRGTSQTAETTRTQLAQHRILEDKDAHTEEVSLAAIELPENINEHAQTFAQTETGVVVELAAGGCGIASILKVVAKARQLNTFREIEIRVSAVSFFDLCDGTVRQGRSKHTLSAFHIHLCYESTHSGDWSLPKMSKTQWRSLPNQVQRIGWHLRGRYSGSIRSCSHGSRAARKRAPWLSHSIHRDSPANLITSDSLQGTNTKQTALALGLAK
jgi:hypothetical protein